MNITRLNGRSGVVDPAVVIGICNRLRIASRAQRRGIIDELVAYAIGEGPAAETGGGMADAGRQTTLRNQLASASPTDAVAISRELRTLRGHDNLFSPVEERT